MLQDDQLWRVLYFSVIAAPVCGLAASEWLMWVLAPEADRERPSP